MSALRSKLVRLAYARPELRQDLLPLLRSKVASAEWVEMSKNELTKELLAQIWEMFVKTYKDIGLKASSINEMLSDYNVWQVAFVGEEAVAFNVAKTTSYGIKSGLSGSNGSPEGKTAIKTFLTTTYKKPGRYSEVSHKVEHIVLKSGTPVVCVNYVPTILKKQVTPSEDGLHYTRFLEGVGPVEKILVGRPKGIPVTDYSNPSCPSNENMEKRAVQVEDDDAVDLDAHVACLAFDD